VNGGDDNVVRNRLQALDQNFFLERLQYNAFLPEQMLNKGGDYIKNKCYDVCMCASSCISLDNQ
jgi:hypothetical protein